MGLDLPAGDQAPTTLGCGAVRDRSGEEKSAAMSLLPREVTLSCHLHMGPLRTSLSSLASREQNR